MNINLTDEELRIELIRLEESFKDVIKNRRDTNINSFINRFCRQPIAIFGPLRFNNLQIENTSDFIDPIYRRIFKCYI